MQGGEGHAAAHLMDAGCVMMIELDGQGAPCMARFAVHKETVWHPKPADLSMLPQEVDARALAAMLETFSACTLNYGRRHSQSPGVLQLTGIWSNAFRAACLPQSASSWTTRGYMRTLPYPHFLAVSGMRADDQHVQTWSFFAASHPLQLAGLLLPEMVQVPHLGQDRGSSQVQSMLHLLGMPGVQRPYVASPTLAQPAACASIFTHDNC